jgi:alpha-beta hydrolase superfamily lysophospholipase
MPVGVVVLSHGYAEHSGRYAHVARRLTDAGYAVYVLDHRGHGRSDGARAILSRFEHVRADLRELVRRAREAHPDLPTVLLGHSLGGLIALDYVVADYGDELAGLVLSGAAVAPAEANPVQRIARGCCHSSLPTRASRRWTRLR